MSALNSSYLLPTAWILNCGQLIYCISLDVQYDTLHKVINLFYMRTIFAAPGQLPDGMKESICHLDVKWYANPSKQHTQSAHPLCTEQAPSSECGIMAQDWLSASQGETYLS